MKVLQIDSRVYGKKYSRDLIIEALKKAKANNILIVSLKDGKIVKQIMRNGELFDYPEEKQEFEMFEDELNEDFKLTANYVLNRERFSLKKITRI